MEKKGRVTLLNGFMTSVNLPNFIEIGISSVTYKYFLNNREDRKQVIKELRVDDAVSFDLFESKGFPYIDNIRKIDEKELKEVKELPKNIKPEDRCNNRNEIIYGLCFKLTFQKWIHMFKIDPLANENKFIQDVDDVYDMMCKSK